MRALSRGALAAIPCVLPALTAAQGLRIEGELVPRTRLAPPAAHEPVSILGELRLDRALRERAPPPAPAPPRPAMQGLIAVVRVNEQDKGEHVVYQGAAGDFLVRREDLQGWMRLPPGLPAQVIDGEAHVSLAAMPGARVDFDEARLVLRISFPPDAFPGQVVNYQASARPRATRGEDVSALLNYQVGRSGTTGESQGTWNATGEASLRWRDWLAQTQAFYVRSTQEDGFVRGLSSITRDDPERLTRLTFGDTTTAPFEITGGVVIGGIGYSRAFELDPYLVRQPTASFRTAVELPSQVDVYVGDTRIHRQTVGPGPLELGNLSYLTGRRDIRVVLRDVLGREREVSFPFYFADRGLAPGLSDFSYVVGALRRNVTTESADYGDLAFSASHRIGVNDWLTLGAQGEGTREFANGGVSAVLRSDRLGVFAAAGLASATRRGGAGGAGFAAWSFQRSAVSAVLVARRSDRNFVSLGAGEGAGPALRDDTATFSYSPGRWGTVSASVRELVPRLEPRSRTATLGYSIPFTREWLFQANYRRTTGFGEGHEFFAGLQFIPSERLTTFTAYRDDGSTRTGSFQVGNLLPEGEGIGYRLGAEVSDTPDGRVSTLTPEVTWQGRYATVQANVTQTHRREGNSGLYDVSARGALAYVGGTFGLARPIEDSFAVARIEPPIPGVRVYLNQQESGRTDANGRVFLPRVVSYVENHVGIDDRDVPIEHALDQKGLTLVPYSRSGTLLAFSAPRTRAIAGVLTYRRGGRVVPLEFVMMTLTVGGKPVEVPTGRGGEFYFENVVAGDYPARVQVPGRDCSFNLNIPSSDETLVRLPDVSACDVP